MTYSALAQPACQARLAILIHLPLPCIWQSLSSGLSIGDAVGLYVLHASKQPNNRANSLLTPPLYAPFSRICRPYYCTRCSLFLEYKYLVHWTVASQGKIRISPHEFQLPSTH
ncbi:hypothetical protein BDZ89DRAFT_27622 [Hymenopellis radicata]|nr:hypothetical protein BDZ89DRAFT_27622 [Hymenopellis radicata]